MSATEEYPLTYAEAFTSAKNGSHVYLIINSSICEDLPMELGPLRYWEGRWQVINRQSSWEDVFEAEINDNEQLTPEFFKDSKWRIAKAYLWELQEYEIGKD